MSHKIVVLKRGFPYSHTIVPFQRSVQQIMGLLERYRCTRIGVMTETIGEIQTTTMIFEKAGAAYRIEFPVTYLESAKKKSLNMNISGRIIHDRIKAILVDVEIGYLEFSQAMMQYRAIPGPDGKAISLQEAYDLCGDRLPVCGFDLRLALQDGGDRR